MPSLKGQPPPLNPKEVEWLLKEKHAGIETPDFQADVERLKKGEPLAYVIGWIPFYDCKIDVSLHPMIPRPETEFWVERAVKELRNLEVRPPSRQLRLADTFSGSGCIGVALLKHLPNATVDLSEFDPKLTEQLRINVRLNGIEESRATCSQADALSTLTGTYDAIFANPPYIDPAAIPEMDASVINYEPHLSLFAGDRGLDYVKLIINDGAKFLNDGGTFYIECDAHQREWIEELLAEHSAKLSEGTPWKHEFWFDQYDQVRFLILRK
jgi:release factor glutamine methyltransferase